MAKGSVARLTREQVLRMAEAERRRREAAEARDVEPARVGGWVLTASQAARLAQAEKLAGGCLDDRRRAARLVKGVQAEIDAVQDAVSVEASIEDALARAAERGDAFEAETVVEGGFMLDGEGRPLRIDGQLVPDVVTVRRARRVDGVTSLFRSGKFDEDDKKVCDQYRAFYMRALPPVRTSVLDPERGGTVDQEAAMAAAMERGFAARDLTRIRLALGLRAARLVEDVVGQGQSLRSIVSGRAYAEAVSSLKDSLKIVGFMLGEVEAERQKSRTGKIDDPER